MEGKIIDENKRIGKPEAVIKGYGINDIFKYNYGSYYLHDFLDSKK